MLSDISTIRYQCNRIMFDSNYVSINSLLCIIILTEKYSQPSHSDFIPRTKQRSALNMPLSQSSEHSGTKSNIFLYSAVFLQLPNCSIGQWAMPRPTRLPQTHDHVALHPLIESNVRLTRATILELTPKLFQPFSLPSNFCSIWWGWWKFHLEDLHLVFLPNPQLDACWPLVN